MYTKRKILIAGIHQKSAIENYYRESFEKLGWEVLFYNIGTRIRQNRNSSIINKIRYKLYPNSFFSFTNIELLKFVEEKKENIKNKGKNKIITINIGEKEKQDVDIEQESQ